MQVGPERIGIEYKDVQSKACDQSQSGRNLSNFISIFG